MSRHAAAPSLRRSAAALLLPRSAPRHRLTPARHRATPASRHLLSALPVLLAGILTVLALASPTASAAPSSTVLVQHAVRLTALPPVVEPAALPAAPTDRIEEDDPRWDCATMGNRACGSTRTDARFPGVTFHYVTTHDASGSPLRTYTVRQYERLTGSPLTPSTASDRY